MNHILRWCIPAPFIEGVLKIVVLVIIRLENLLLGNILDNLLWRKRTKRSAVVLYSPLWSSVEIRQFIDWAVSWSLLEVVIDNHWNVYSIKKDIISSHLVHSLLLLSLQYNLFIPLSENSTAYCKQMIRREMVPTNILCGLKIEWHSINKIDISSYLVHDTTLFSSFTQTTF